MTMVTKKMFSISQLIMIDVLILLLGVLCWWGYNAYQEKYPSKVDLVKIAQDASQNGDYQKAVEYYEKASTKGELDKNSLSDYGIASYNLENYEKSEEIYQNVLTQDENNYEILNNLGNVYRDQKKYELAEEYYKKAWMLKPDNINIYNNFILLYSLMDNNSASIQIIEEGLEKVSDKDTQISMYYLLISLYQNYNLDNKDAKIKEYYQKVYELDPEDAGAKEYLGK